MEKLKSYILSKNGITNDIEKYFISIWAELFNYDTIDTYRVRNKNAKSILLEFIDIIDTKFNEISSNENIKFITEEACRIVEKDIVLNKCYYKELEFLKKDLKKNVNFDFPSLKERLAKIKYFLNLFAKDYCENLVKELSEEIKTGDQEKIYKITSILATELLNKGYSYMYLYELKNKFILNEEADFLKSLNKILRDDLNKKYTLYIKFTFKSEIKDLVTNDIILNSVFKKKNNDENEASFIAQSGNFIAEINNIESLDHYNAVKKGINKFGFLLDLIKFEFRKDLVYISPKILVYDDTKTYYVDNKTKPIGFIQKGNIKNLEKIIDSISQTMNNSLVDEISKIKISNSVRYFRMSLDQPFTESRFLHLWISLEFLMSTNNNTSVILEINKYIPKILGLGYPRKLLIDLISNFKRIENINLFPTENKKNKFLKLYESIINESDKTQLQNKIKSPLLKKRFEIVCEYFCNPKKLHNKINFHLDNVKWNLQRIYRLRNKIAHSANIDINLEQIESNLYFYYISTINCILYNIRKTNTNQIEDVLLMKEANFDFLFNKLKGVDPKFDLKEWI